MNEVQELVARGFRPEEAAAILAGLGRLPNRTEEALLRVLWSEHCSYKHSRLLLRQLPTTGPQVAVGPGQNAGALRLGGGWCLVVKIESHNHPSAIEPFQGAATGLGGILRDILAMGARPIAFLDALFFGDGPESAFHRRGVVAGIAHYGNAVGVPTVGGEWHEAPVYARNPLVNCLAAGLLREEACLPSAIPEPGLPLLLLGAPTGRDGLAGAAFASQGLSGEDDVHRVEVQVGDPFLGKLLVEATLAIAEEGHLLGLGDLGAAGLTSAAAEMAQRGGVGVVLELDRVHLREAGMDAEAILLSESQERMLLVGRPGHEEAIAELAKAYGVPCRWIGRSDTSGRFRAVARGDTVVDLPLELLAGCPTAPLPAGSPVESDVDVTPPRPTELWPVVAELLRRRPAGGPRTVYRRYDWAVGLRTVLGPGHDAAVLRLLEGEGAVALVTKSAPRQAAVDARAGAELAVAWAALALASVGAQPIGLTDGLNFGDPEDPQVAAAMRATVAGIARAARRLNMPVVSGNVSLYNTSPAGPIWPTAVIGGVGRIPAASPIGRSVVSAEGLLLTLLGRTDGSLGGSLWQALVGQAPAGRAAQPELETTARLVELLPRLWREGVIEAAHTVDEGGLLLALWQMTAGGGLGFRALRPWSIHEAFAEGGGRVAVAVARPMLAELERLAREAGIPLTVVAEVVAGESRCVVDGESLRLGGMSDGGSP